MGFQGSGKTTIGRKLAERYFLPFYDTDALVLHKSGSVSCKEIVEERGISYFRALEKEVIATLKPTVPSVIALGGGAMIDPENVKHLKAHGRLIYLQITKDEAEERHRLTYTDFEAVYQERAPLFKTLADITIDVDPTCQEIPSELSLRS